MKRYKNNWIRKTAAWILSLLLALAPLAQAQMRPPAPGRPAPPTRPRPNPAAPDPSSAGGESTMTTSVSPSGQRLISLNFRDAPLDQVLGFYGELTGRTMIKAPGLNATITLRGQTRLSQEDALDAITSILAMNNVTLVPMGDKFFKVVQTATARQEGMPIQAQLPDAPFAETDQLISQLVTLQHIQIADAQPIIQTLLHGYGKIQPLERINSMLITATSGNLQRLIEVLDFIDKPVELKVETRIYELRYAEAGKIAAKLNELIQTSKDQTKDQGPQVAPPAQEPSTIRGVIRARRPGLPEAQPESPTMTAAELAERGIIQGDVKIVSDERTNIMIVISEPPNFIFFDKIVAVLDRPVEPEIIVRVVALEYADSEEISGILNSFIGAASAESKVGGATADADGEQTGGSKALQRYIENQAAQRTVAAPEGEKTAIGQLSPNTKILSDKRTNSLLLMGRKSDIAALEEVIDQLDIMLAQVLIEAIILEVNLSDNMAYGMEWLQRAVNVYDTDNAGPGGGVQVRQPVMSFAGGQQFGQNTGFQDASGLVGRDIPLSAGALTYYSTFFDLNLDVIIRMLASSSNARILQTPVILTTDNTEAKIVVGEERPIVTSTTTSSSTDNQTSHYEYKNIGVNLTVTPRINPARFVVMEISQTVDNVGDFVRIDGNDVPVITKREMSAQISIESRSTIILGGLVQTGDRFGRSKVPILGDIPILGALFRSDSKDKSRTELMVMLTPYVMTTPEEAREETLRLKNASRAGDTPWPKGWSDSPIATPTIEETKERKRAERAEQKKQARDARRAKRARQLEKSANEKEEARRKALFGEAVIGDVPATAVETMDTMTENLYGTQEQAVYRTDAMVEEMNEQDEGVSEVEAMENENPLPEGVIQTPPTEAPHSDIMGTPDESESLSDLMNDINMEQSEAPGPVLDRPVVSPMAPAQPAQPQMLRRTDPVLPGNGHRPEPAPSGQADTSLEELISELETPVPR
ncbi:MAG: type II secretion system protein GspD [Spartobacteria bacterium]|nr:type II secretion system protein GspD [Spartobacteria bacterium]